MTLAIFYLVGFKTRASNLLLWLLILSLHNRNVLVLNSGDDFLRMLLFWSIFMPVGERFSVDAASQTAVPQCMSLSFYLLYCYFIRGKKMGEEQENGKQVPELIYLVATNRYLSFTSVCFLLQIMAIFWVGYLLKTGLEWEEGTAMYYLFSIDQYTTPFGYFILRFPNFLVLLTKLHP